MAHWLIILIPAFPLAACLATWLLGPRLLKEHSHWPAVLGCGLACLCSLALVFAVREMPEKQQDVMLWQWIEIPAMPVAGATPAKPLVNIPIVLHADSLSATMLAMLTFVATLVAIYGSGYMHGDTGYWRFFTYVSLFVFSMINLVLAGNFLQLFMFWEAVGLCSYLLIGFWYEKPAAAAAGMKAFIVNRVGDFGFGAGIFLVWTTFGSITFADVLDPVRIAQQDPTSLVLIGLLLFMGACGKSAQFPLHVWLPDAMEGPTPVSALIHAATMVTAGVYMVARCTPLYMAIPDVQVFIAMIGGFTALLAALIALTQTDLKRVLAYSTVSQLGFMFLGLGAGSLLGVSGAMFHLVTHAFFKALLFLGAGSVMHAMGGVIDMRHFSGLRKVMPQTYITFVIGSLALSGIVPLSGFWSKDTILSAVKAAANPEAHAVAHADSAHDGKKPHDVHAKPVAVPSATTRQPIQWFGMRATTIYNILYYMASFTAFLTAFYTFRAVFMTFHGPEKIPHEAGHHAHESPLEMTGPLWVLSLGAIFLGMSLGHATGIFDGYLARTIPGMDAHHATDWPVVITSIVLAFLGVGLAWFLYGNPSPIPAKLAAAFGPLTKLSQNKFYLDEAYAALLMWPLRVIAQISKFLDWFFIDTILVDGIGKLPGFLVGKSARPMHNGLMQFYALSMMLAMAVLLWALLLKQG